MSINQSLLGPASRARVWALLAGRILPQNLWAPAQAGQCLHDSGHVQSASHTDTK